MQVGPANAGQERRRVLCGTLCTLQRKVAQMTTTLSVRIDSDTKKQLEALANGHVARSRFLPRKPLLPMSKQRAGNWMRFRLASQSSTKVAVSRTTMCRSGFFPVAGIEGRAPNPCGGEGRVTAPHEEAWCGRSACGHTARRTCESDARCQRQ